MLKILVAFAVLVVAISLAPTAFADTTLTLDPIPGKAYEGQTVTFTGTLYADGWPLAGKTVWIQEDDFGPDDVLASGRTDQNGRFSINWRADAATIETEFDIYAIFEGDSSHGKDRTRNQYMDVFERRGTTVTLHAIPDHVYAGDSITFTGTLTHGGQPLVGKTVWIQDEDEFREDDYLASGRTDGYGRFSITWVARVDSLEDEREIRAVFEGDSSYGRDTSPIQGMYVTKIGGDISLDLFPRTAKVGQTVTFSGTLSLDRGSPAGAAVYIKDEDSLSRDELLATGYVESDGRFSATWVAEHMDSFDDTLEIFAVFESDGRYSRQSTCNTTCGDAIPLHISGRVSPPAPPPAPGVPGGTQYMEMYYALDLYGPPHVAIVPDPDTYASVKSHMAPAQEGILTWVYALEREHGGNWDVTFEIIHPGDRFDVKPDVVMNIVTHESESKCLKDYAGVALIYSTSKPVQTKVCSTSYGEKRPNQDVARTAGHEFIHVMGLGHAFNKPGDVMCSVEDGIPTCVPEISRSSIPSNLNLGAVAQMYGADGFANPNNDITYKSRFAEGTAGAQPNVQPPVTQPPTTPQTRTHTFPNGCTTNDSPYHANLRNYELDPGWYRLDTICNTGTVQYSFATTARDAGFALYVLPPAADAEDYMDNGDGYPHPCEDTESRWFSKSNTCYLSVGSSIILHNDSDVPITINGYITTNVRQQSFPNGCTTDEARYDAAVNDSTLNPGAFSWYTICNTGPVNYSFSTATSDTGFRLYVLPPETDVNGYVNDGRGYYYTCEDPNDVWHSKPGTCNVEVGSRIVLHNDSAVSITISGNIRT